MTTRLVTDVGGLAAGPVPKEEIAQLFWQKQMIAVFNLLWLKGVINLDEFRRKVEEMTYEEYKKSTFYGRRFDGMLRLVIEKGHIDAAEFDARAGQVFAAGRQGLGEMQ